MYNSTEETDEQEQGYKVSDACIRMFMERGYNTHDMQQAIQADITGVIDLMEHAQSGRISYYIARVERLELYLSFL